MQIQILNGIYCDENADFRTSYPRNLIPVPKEQGISKGYLRPADGLVSRGTGPGVDRGGINWNGVEYRVLGPSLCRISSTGAVTVLGTIAGTNQVTMDYSFDRLGIAGGGRLHYWDGSVLSFVTDVDMGTVVDALWVDGYWMTTDGTSLIVTELTNPLAVNPLKYGSSEVDPDRVLGLLKLHNEPAALNRHTIEFFDNIGGDLFPYQRIKGAQINRGPVGTHAAVVFSESGADVIAFVGGGRNEPPAVWVGANSSSAKISTREIDAILKGYTEAQLALCLVESRIDESHRMLYIHLPDQTLVYDSGATAALGVPVWFTLTSSVVGLGQYRARNLVWAYDAWQCSDPTSTTLGSLAGDISTHYGTVIGWEFGTQIIYNESMGAIFHMLELVCLPGRVPLGADPVVWTSFSVDGETWSMEYACPAGKQGQRTKRLTWSRQGHMRAMRIQKFRGTSDAHLSVARLEATVEALYA
jgi:hypothetical protein